VVEKYKKLDEIPFDFTRRMMSVLVEDRRRQGDPAHQGGSGRGLPPCSHFELDGKLSPMDPDLMVGLKQEYDEPQQRRLPRAGGGNKGAAGEADLREG
jgi:P-type Mg2+ transporter